MLPPYAATVAPPAASPAATPLAAAPAGHQQQPAVRCKAIALEADDVAAACCRSGGRQQLGEVFALLQEVDERTTAWHVRNAAALEQKRVGLGGWEEHVPAG